MSLQFESIGNFNPFDYIECPFCGSENFISYDHASVNCNTCQVKFETRYTSGDPGVVIDSVFKDCGCLFSTRSFNAEFITNLKKFNPELIDGLLFRRENYKGYHDKSEEVKAQCRKYENEWKEFTKGFVLWRVLKTGEYDSGWSTYLTDKNKGTFHWKHESCEEKWFDWLNSNYSRR